MGTSLSGLTPATTFDGLLKVGDNDPLTADLKAISDGSGNDSAIQLSTGELKVLGQFNVDTDTATTTMNLRGDGLNINQVYHANETTYNSISLLNSGGIRLKNNATNVLVVRNNKVGIGTDDPDETLHIKGSGATSATTSLLVQNSAGTNIFKVVDDNTMLYHTHKFRSAGGYLYIEGEGNPDRSLKIGQSFTASSYGGHIFKTYDGTAYTEAMRITGANDQFVGIGVAAPTARLHVKGDGGAAFLVENSIGGEILKVADNGNIYVTSLRSRTNGGVYQNMLSSIDWGGAINYSFNSTTGGLRPPRMTTTQRDAIATPATGLTLVDTDTNTLNLFDGTSWQQFGPQTVIKGSGSDNTTTALLVQNSAGTELFKVQDDNKIYFGEYNYTTGTYWYGNYTFLSNLTSRGTIVNDIGSVKVNDDLNVGGNADNDTGVRLQVKSSGATSATTALLVQNSAGTELMSVDDDGAVRANSIKGINYQNNHLSLGANAEFLNFLSITAPKIGVNAAVPTGTQAIIKGSGNDATTTALLVQNSDGLELLSLDDIGGVRLGGDGNTTTKANIKLDAYNGLFNVTTAKFGNWNGAVYAVFSGLSKTDALFAFGNDTTTASTRMHIKGLGTTSATTALLVENSAGAELLQVKDDGNISVKSIRPVNSGDIGIGTNAAWLFRNIYSKGVTHITDNTTSSTTLDASAKLQVDSTTQGFLPPRMTDAERDAIATPAAGLMIYDTSNNQMNYWNGSTWIAF